MDNKPSFDVGILAPIALAVLSILGMAAVFFINRTNALQPAEEIPATDTPFRYIYLGTEPGLSTLTPEPTETSVPIEPPAPTEGSFSTPTALPPFFTSLPTNPAFPTQPAARTPTPTASATLHAVLSKFDDTYYEILYDGNWTGQTNVTDAYQNTLHISFETENYALFTFVGEQIIVTYQAGPSLGEILITIDGLEYPAVSQSNGSTLSVSWPSPEFAMGTHEIVIEHLSGGSVNIDALTIPDLSATVTPTP
jgi:hypothetical protein